MVPTSENVDLPIVVQRRVNCYLHNALFLCVLLAQENCHPWFMENYAQVYFNRAKPRKIDDRTEVWLDLYGGWTAPAQLLEQEFVPRQSLVDADPIKYVEESVGSGRYIYSFWDEAKLPGPSPKPDVRVHDVLIYGFSRNARSVSVLGFDSNQQFRPYRVGYETFRRAFGSGIESANDDSENYADVFDAIDTDTLKRCTDIGFHSIQFAPRFDRIAQYQYSPSRFAASLSDYLGSRVPLCDDDGQRGPTSINYHLPGNVFGISVYDGLAQHVQQMPTGACVDYRPFHTLVEHKQLLRDRIEYASLDLGIGSTELLRQFDRVVHLQTTCRMLALKQTVSRSTRELDRIAGICAEIRTTERKVLFDYLERLQNAIP